MIYRSQVQEIIGAVFNALTEGGAVIEFETF